ncbi:thermonuclease family protein [bacterium]|nr:thermonuclease family protein [bacterium]
MRNIFKLFIFIFAISIYGEVTINDSYLVGEFPLKKVVDGDTIGVDGLKESIRILFIDTEEAFKHKTAYEKTKEISDNWDDYLASKIYATKNKPIKYNTPNGYQAAVWAKEFFSGVSVVRLEYDNLESKKGFYGRYLAYVFAKKGNKWVNFNLEIVKHGYSPYSTKYGRSIRFHKEFVEAQKFAQEKKLGIWNPKGKHYPDYDARLTWWDKRGEQIDVYRNKHKQNYLFIGGNDFDYYKLKEFVNKKVKVFGLMRDVTDDGDEYIFKMPFKQFVDVFVHISKRSGIKDETLKKHDDYYVYIEADLKMDQNGKYHIYIKQQSEMRFE